MIFAEKKPNKPKLLNNLKNFYTTLSGLSSPVSSNPNIYNIHIYSFNIKFWSIVLDKKNLRIVFEIIYKT